MAGGSQYDVEKSSLTGSTKKREKRALVSQPWETTRNGGFVEYYEDLG